MTAPAPQSIYTTRSLDAVARLQADDFERCIQLAKDNLTDPTLPRYYRMKNLLLVASSEDDWYVAERCRLEVEQIWYTVNRLTDGCKAEITALQEIRTYTFE